MTPESFTDEGSSLDGLVLSYFIFRMIITFFMVVMTSRQLYIEIEHTKRALTNPKWWALVGVLIFSMDRFIYSIAVIIVKDYEYGSIPVLIGMFSTFGVMSSWCFIGCFWSQLLFILFLGSKINLQYSNKIWYLTWAEIGLVTVYTVSYMIISIYYLKFAATFYMIGFLTIICVFGSILFAFGVILWRQMKIHQNDIRSDRIKKTVAKIKYLSIFLMVIVVSALIRDLIWKVAFPNMTMNDNARHLSNFITFFLETLGGVVVMIAVGDEPFNYFYLKDVIPFQRAHNTLPNHHHTVPNQPPKRSMLKPTIATFKALIGRPVKQPNETDLSSMSLSDTSTVATSSIISSSSASTNIHVVNDSTTTTISEAEKEAIELEKQFKDITISIQ
ncbi:hypothetical protein DFA_00502 [Cavenderia fasciculata]|uniref:THH1/TOM1/TOM3 domain-containing protein n=1 Tax=Cavenderia fasciculata TaxID=261658 RepID=F4PS95_CACFS|nr:uncharacterized protein DFA_00502 [Cavenderia fasciculata]EGG20641.1 hypothetical protein DFA_00502 [Cavenderia fasciculata]|eukprot:XP_004358491.1 hypothetical protein DFA_00502 [Cavenderia fasciculata]